MPVRVEVAPAVLSWVLEVTGADVDHLAERFAVRQWIDDDGRQPTVKQLEGFARASGVPFGYLLLDRPPTWTLPIADLREGFDARATPSADLVAVLGQSQRRQQWYRDEALELGLPRPAFVGTGTSAIPIEAAAMIRAALGVEVADRQGSWTDLRRRLLRVFEALGGLTVATSVVGNNVHRPLDADEFRGFALVDDIAPLIFVNTRQTMNGQIFTVAHELAHVWHGTSGIGNESLREPAQLEIERWCNAVASEVLVPRVDLVERHARVTDRDLAQVLETLAHRYRCGTLVVLQALHRDRVRTFENYQQVYDAEVARLRGLTVAERRSGGDSYNTMPFRIGERFSKAIVSAALEGRTTISEAMELMSIRSLSTFDEYAARIGAA